MKQYFRFLTPVLIIIVASLFYENPSPSNQISLIKTEIPNSVNYYIGNKNTKKFHLPSCSFLPYEHNRIYFTEREDAINSYFDPCLKCEP